jgi:Abnormal spindle-like microcephaly-assoc'd, ASPM-SPD-2-Hydin
MHERWLTGLVILAAAISIGCGSGSVSASARAKKPVVRPGELAVTPASLSFGTVAVGQKITKAATLTAGDSRIKVTSANWSGEGYSVSGIVFPVTVAAGQSVSFKVSFSPARAGSSAGNISFVSDAANSPHGERFSGNGTAQSRRHAVTLAWRANSGVAGYNIYRAATPKGPYAKINPAPQPVATFTDASVQGGQTYFYMTTAVDKKGRESKFSNLVQVTLPNS